MSIPTYKNRVAGEWTAAEEQKTRTIESPWTGKPIAEVPESSARDVMVAAEAAFTAFHGTGDADSWRHALPSVKATALNRIADTIEAHADMLIEAEVQQCGKLTSAVRDVELPHIIDIFRFYAGQAQAHRIGPVGSFIDGTVSHVIKAPVGPVGVILPWNYPLMLMAWKLAPALAAGCTVVIKPDEKTPITALMLAELCEDILPPGTVNVVCGGPTAGKALASAAPLSMVCFTGSQQIGVSIQQAAAPRRTHLELGGNCPAVIDTNAPIGVLAEWAARLSGIVTFNAGASCAKPERLLVYGPGVDEFTNQLANQLSQVTFADGPDGEGLQPCISTEHVAHIDSMTHASSGQVLVGGQWNKTNPRRYPASLVVNPNSNDLAVKREIFGPVAVIQTVPGLDHALAEANALPFDLAASVWSVDPNVQRKAWKQIMAGEVWVNTALEQTPELPHGGVCWSGHGTDMSADAVHDYCYAKTITARV